METETHLTYAKEIAELRELGYNETKTKVRFSWTKITFSNGFHKIVLYHSNYKDTWMFGIEGTDLVYESKFERLLGQIYVSSEKYLDKVTELEWAMAEIAELKAFIASKNTPD
jgi:hypothetical protein